MLEEGLDDLALFARVLEQPSLSAASRTLRIPKSSLSRRLDALEQRLGVTLLQRRASGLAPTNDGRQLYERTRTALSDLARAQEELRQSRHGQGGLLRISAPPEIGRAFLLPALSRVMRADPTLCLDVELTPRPVDLGAEGFDVVIRSGRVEDPQLRARLLFRVEALLVASPRCLQRGAPSAPEELASYRCLRHSTGRAEPAAWTLTHPRLGNRVVALPAAFSVNDMEALTPAALSGLGIARLPALLCAADLAAGRLVRVLPEWSLGVRRYYLAHAGGKLQRRHRTLIDGLLAGARETEGALAP